MKRKILLIITVILAVALVFSGCGLTHVYLPSGNISDSGGIQASGNTSDSDNIIVIEPAIQSQVSESYGVNFTESKTRAMSNFMLENRYIHSGNTLFGQRHSSDGSSNLSVMKFSAVKAGMYVRETEIIEQDIDARFLALKDGYLYYLREDNKTHETAIMRMSVEKGAEYNPQPLYRGSCDSLAVRGDKIYFNDGDYHLMSMNLDGTNLTQVFADKAVYYPYFISDSVILFQDDQDGETLHLRYIPTGYEMRISQGRTYEYVISGHYLYFPECVSNENDMAEMIRVNLNEFFENFNPDDPPEGFVFTREESPLYMGTRFCVNGDRINASNYKTVPLEDWKSLSDDQYEVGYKSACQYVSENFEIFFNYNDDGLIDKVLFYEPAEKRPSYIELKAD